MSDDLIHVVLRVLVAYARSRHEPERAPRQQGWGFRSQHSFQVQAGPSVVSSQRNYSPTVTHSAGFNAVKSSVWSGDTQTQYGPGNQTFMGGEFTRKRTRGKNYRALQTVSDDLLRARQHPAMCFVQVLGGKQKQRTGNVTLNVCHNFRSNAAIELACFGSLNVRWLLS